MCMLARDTGGMATISQITYAEFSSRTDRAAYHDQTSIVKLLARHCARQPKGRNCACLFKSTSCVAQLAICESLLNLPGMKGVSSYARKSLLRVNSLPGFSQRDALFQGRGVLNFVNKRLGRLRQMCVVQLPSQELNLLGGIRLPFRAIGLTTLSQQFVFRLHSLVINPQMTFAE